MLLAAAGLVFPVKPVEDKSYFVLFQQSWTSYDWFFLGNNSIWNSNADGKNNIFHFERKIYVKGISFGNSEQLKKHDGLKCKYGNWCLGCCGYYVNTEEKENLSDGERKSDEEGKLNDWKGEKKRKIFNYF